MYSSKARWQKVVEIDAPKEMLIDIAQRHKSWHALTHVDYYFARELGLFAVTEDKVYQWHRDVDSWRWENMEKIL